MTAIQTNPWVSDSTVYPKLLELAACLCQQIADAQLPEPCFCGVLPGAQVALEYLDPCSVQDGMAWVRLVSMQPTGLGIGTICPTPMGVTVEVGIVRSIPVGDDQGNPPKPEVWLDAVDLQMADKQAALRALVCCLGFRDWSLDGYSPVGPDGGVVGGFWVATAPETT